MEFVRRASSVATLSSAIEHAFPFAGLWDQVKPHRLNRQQTLKAVLMRAGTSKGMFVHRKDLPAQREKWSRVLSAAMGSRYSDPRQLDGLGGASSTTSKAAIVARSTRHDADVDYTFAQVSVGQDKVDFRGSCGNICSGVAAFAIDEGIVQPVPGDKEALVRVHDTNSGSIIDQLVQVDEYGRYKAHGEHKIPGYAGTGSPVQMAWKNAMGACSPRGLMFPTNTPSDTVSVAATSSSPAFTCKATLIDVTNPFVFVDASSLPANLRDMPASDTQKLEAIEAIRCQASILFGFATTVEEATNTKAVPKIGLLYPPTNKDTADIRVVPYSMGKPHPSFQMTGVMCLSTALSYPGTVAADVAHRAKGLAPLTEVQTKGTSKKIEHSGGIAEGVVFNEYNEHGESAVDKVAVVTTASKIFKGEVSVHHAELD